MNMSEKAARRAIEWIPCSGRLPDNFVDVLVSHKGRVSLGIRMGKDWMITNGNGSFVITDPQAWLPLPSAYEGGNHGGL